ncbi:MAG: alpha/beta fold hydrolase [Erythrobacter sp.]
MAQEPEAQTEIEPSFAIGEKSKSFLDPLAAAEAKPPLIATSVFAARGTFRNLDLSPDGKKLVLTKGTAHNRDIHIVDPATMETVKVITFGDAENFDWARWLGNDRLIVARSVEYFREGQSRPKRRLSVHQVNSGDTFELSIPNSEWIVRELVHLDRDARFVVMSVQEQFGDYPSVYRFDIAKGSPPVRLANPIKGVWNWVTDEEGVVRLGAGWIKKRLHVYYRKSSDHGFSLIGKLRPEDRGVDFWEVARIIGGSDYGFILEEGESGRIGIQRFDFASGIVLGTFYEHPEYDLDGYTLGEDGLPEKAYLTSDREEVVWFTDEGGKEHAAIKAKLDAETVAILDDANNGSTKLIWAGDEANPGALYLSTNGINHIRKLADYRLALDSAHLVYPKPIEYTARDGLKIRAYLTLPKGRSSENLPLIVLPHGGPFGVRDSLVYNDEVQLLANRGYAVIQPNFRGSGGFGNELYIAGNGEIGRKMQDDLDDAVDWAIGQRIADKNRVCVVGGSYGGYAALWAVIRTPERYRCAASWAGVTDLEAQIKYTGEYLSRSARKEWSLQLEGKRKVNLAEVSPITFAEKLSRPVLLAHGTRDYIVPFGNFQAFEVMSNNAPVRVKKLVVTGEGHSFSSAQNEKSWYDALDFFLAKHNPADQVDSKGRLLQPEVVLED